jgi:phage shock protein A
MSLFRRILSQLTAWLKALFAPAEDPRQTYAHAYQRQRQLLVRVQGALADTATAKNRLASKTSEVKSKLPQLEEQARRALIADREDLARLALRRHQVATVELQTLEEQAREVEQEEQRLSLTEQRLATQIEAFFARQEIIAARYSAAEAQVRINEALGGVSQELTDLDQALQEAEEKAEYMQARASAIDRLIEGGILDTPGLSSVDPLKRDLSQIDVAQAVEERLKALKSEILESKLPPQP